MMTVSLHETVVEQKVTEKAESGVDSANFGYDRLDTPGLILRRSQDSAPQGQHLPVAVLAVRMAFLPRQYPVETDGAAA